MALCCDRCADAVLSCSCTCCRRSRVPCMQIRTRCPDGRILLSNERFTPRGLLLQQKALEPTAAEKGEASTTATSETAPGVPSSSRSSDSSSSGGSSSGSGRGSSSSSSSSSVASGAGQLRTVRDAAADARTGLPLLSRSAFDGASSALMTTSRRGSSATVSSSLAATSGTSPDSLPGWNLVPEAIEPITSEEEDSSTSSDDDPEAGIEQAGIKVFLFGVQHSLVRQAVSAVDRNARVRLVTHIKVRARRPHHLAGASSWLAV